MASQSIFSDKTVKQQAHSDIETEIASLQATIRACQEKICRCRTRQNNLISIIQLPDELLIEIFMHLVLEESTTMTLRWIRLTHVCAHWRRIALECPRLWSWPCFKRGKPAEVMLQRSRSVPLNIVISLNGQCGEKELEMALSSMTRAQTLTGYEIDRILCEYYLKKHRGSILDVPLLRSISLSTTDIRARRLSLEGVHINVPELRRLRLHNWALPSTVVLTPSPSPLTSLHVDISRDRYQALQQNSFKDILLYLRHFSQLQHIYLDNVFAPLHEGELEDTLPEPANLPSLKNIYVHDSVRICSLLFKCISYPAQATTILVRCIPHKEDSQPAIRELLQVTLNRIPDPVRALHILAEENAKERFSLNFWTTLCNEDLDYTEQPAQVALSMPFNRDILNNLCQALPLQNLEHLFYHEAFSHSPLWRDFGSLQHLWLLDIRHTHYCFLETLMSPSARELMTESSSDDIGPSSAVTSGTAEVGPKPLYFNALRDLSLNEWSFDSIGHSGVSSLTLVKCLRRREDHGRRLTNLHLWSCEGITCEDAEKLLEVAGQVFWDG